MPGGRPAIGLAPYRDEILQQLRERKSFKSIAVHLQASYNLKVSGMTVRRYITSLEKLQRREVQAPQHGIAQEHGVEQQQGQESHIQQQMHEAPADADLPLLPEDLQLVRRTRHEVVDTPEIRQVVNEAYMRYNFSDDQILKFFDKVGINIGKRGLQTLRRRMGLYRRVNGAK